MADEPPASLRQADPNIYKTATRAAQLQSVKPIVAYWCDYWVLKQILAKGLHSSSPDILDYSTQLMDKLEQTKSEHAGEDAILDDTAGQAYVEQFAQETLDRAQRVVRANKVTAMTANTFDAAASFFGLITIWGPPEQENLQKIKYAKWNAARILKALKEGKDPNESNPRLDEEGEDQDAGGGGGIGSLSLSPGPTPAAAVPRPVTIEDETDDDGALHLPDVPAAAAAAAAAAQTDDTTPTIPSAPSFDPASPVGDDAVPVVPSPPSPPAVLPTFLPPQPPLPDHPEPYYHQQPQNSQPRTGYTSTPSAAVTGFPPPSAQPSLPRAPPPQPQRAPAAAAVVDDAAMASAQKHAKWAISALNFEDVTTAVRELHNALEFLGAS